MCFCYLVRNALAYVMVIFALWGSLLGPLYHNSFVKNNEILKIILKSTINVQDQIMFSDRIINGIYKITTNETVFFLCVIMLTIIIFFQLTCAILNRIEIK